jgi:thiol:disulfide interchange protein DsbA
MKRRDFSALASAVLAASVLPVSVARAQAKGFSPGFEYKVMDPRAPVDSPAGKIEVVEFFSYMCPHCNVFEPAFHAWTKRVAADVVVRRMPVSFMQNADVLQRMYFTLEAMGLVDKLHAKVFTAIHSDHRNFRDAGVAADWAASQGVDRAKFLEQFSSFTTATKVTRATQLQNAYKIEGVPSLGVAGRFLTDGPMAGTMDRALQVVDALVVQARASK